MPFITIDTWPIPKETKPLLIEKITEAVTSVFPNMPKEAVTILIKENSKDNWANGGVQHSEKFKDR